MPSHPASTPGSGTSREKILDVAEALFARRGFAGVGLRGVAERAGLCKSALFHHFRSKRQLYGDVLDRVLQRIGERLEPGLRLAAGPAERLERTIELLVDALAEHPTTARLLLRGLFEDDEFGGDTPPEMEAAERTLAAILADITRLLQEGVATGAFRTVSVPDTLQSLIGASVYHFASADLGEGILGGPLFSAGAVARRRRELIQLFHHGLTAGAPAAAADPSQGGETA